MPRLSAFYGIVIYIYLDDHSPPHYHAVYGEHEAWIVIASGAVRVVACPSPSTGANLASPAPGRTRDGLEKGQGKPDPGYD